LADKNRVKAVAQWVITMYPFANDANFFQSELYVTRQRQDVKLLLVNQSVVDASIHSYLVILLLVDEGEPKGAKSNLISIINWNGKSKLTYFLAV
jgi:hypothetical protein